MTMTNTINEDTISADTVAEVNSKIKDVLKQSQIVEEQSNKINAYADSAMKAAQQYKEFHASFCRNLLHELIQKHIYNVTGREDYDQLIEKKDSINKQLHKCRDIEERKNLVSNLEIIEDRINRFLIQAVYLGALHDVYTMPKTMEELQFKFCDDINPFIDMGVLSKRD